MVREGEAVVGSGVVESTITPPPHGQVLWYPPDYAQAGGMHHTVITARVAKRAKVMFSQAFVCPSLGRGGGR